MYDPQIDRDRRIQMARQAVVNAPNTAQTMLDLAEQRVARIRGVIAVKTGDYEGTNHQVIGTDPRVKLYNQLDEALETVAEARRALTEAQEAAASLPPLAPVVPQPILSAHEVELRNRERYLIEVEQRAQVERQRHAILIRDQANLDAMRAAEAAEAQRLTDTKPKPITSASITIQNNRAALANAMTIAGNT